MTEVRGKPDKDETIALELYRVGVG